MLILSNGCRGVRDRPDIGSSWRVIFTMKAVLLQVFISLAVLRSSFAIYCYECGSIFDARCSENLKPYPKAIVNCDEKPIEVQGVMFNATFCRKITQIGEKWLIKVFQRKQSIFFFLVYGQTRVTRSCGYLPNEKKRTRCLRVSLTEATSSLYCECDEDFCNGFSGAGQLTLSGLTLIGLAFVLKIVQ